MLAVVSGAGPGHRKKLEEAARLWARRELTNEEEHVQQETAAQDSLSEQFAALGIQPDGPVHVAQPLQPFYLFPENVEAWRLFGAVQTQWRGGTAREGLDYPGVQIVIAQRRAWRLRRRRLMAEILVMERACLDEWGKQAAETHAAQERRP